MVVWWLGCIGICISFIGSIFLFKGTPKDTDGFARTVGSDYQTQQKLLAKRLKNTKVGFLFLIVGFLVQMIAMLFNYPLGQ
ncbi:hypothetical protein [Schinkia azotoformans]|uniref:hypothetical protein n=1 Tax=Schinkia azotoformans TaxID=1454 RepID=UPI002DB8339A|nr:hypothetical protein [Schinkia azotoformans]MEC1719047.1 hypothetical protein [Schinkia azotoformans]MED4413904.1 hypothetical protein [Schinkia azotoformans]